MKHPISRTIQGKNECSELNKKDFNSIGFGPLSLWGTKNWVSMMMVGENNGSFWILFTLVVCWFNGSLQYRLFSLMEICQVVGFAIIFKKTIFQKGYFGFWRIMFRFPKGFVYVL